MCNRIMKPSPIETLDAHLTRLDKSTSAFADEIGKPSETVRRWRKHICVPQKNLLPKIEEATGGLVTGASFFLPLPEKQQGETP
jgi:hypothetical protein